MLFLELKLSPLIRLITCFIYFSSPLDAIGSEFKKLLNHQRFLEAERPLSTRAEEAENSHMFLTDVLLGATIIIRGIKICKLL